MINQCSVYCQLRDEDLLLPFFVNHYLNSLKFDHIYIYDDNSLNPIFKLEFIQPFIKSNKITVCRADFNLDDFNKCNEKFTNSNLYDVNIYKKYKSNRQVYFMNHFIKNYKSINKWVLFCDGDEFLYIKNFDNISSFINYYHQKYNNMKVLSFLWLKYGSSYHSYFPLRNHLFESFLLSDEYLNFHTKCIANIHEITGMYIHSPIKLDSQNHFLLNPNSQDLITVSHFESTYFNTNKITETNIKIKANEIDAFIAHFIITDCFNYVKRRFIRNRPNAHVTRTEVESIKVNQSNSLYNTALLKYIENPRPLISIGVQLNKVVNIDYYNKMYKTEFTNLYQLLLDFYSKKRILYYEVPFIF